MKSVVAEQSQVNAPPLAEHTPLFWQGLEAQGLTAATTGTQPARVAGDESERWVRVVRHKR